MATPYSSVEIPHNINFLQALATVASLLLTQLHFQTMHTTLEARVRLMVDFTWMLLLSTILVSLVHIFLANRHRVAPHIMTPAILGALGIGMMFIVYAILNKRVEITTFVVIALSVILLNGYFQCRKRADEASDGSVTTIP